MFYNSYRATRSALQRRQNSRNPKSHLLNQPKRQQLKNLLMTKFTQKYNIKDTGDYLDLVLTQFIQTEKLNDTDLKKLDLKIKRLNKEYNNNKRKFKSDLENQFKTQMTETNNRINNTTNDLLKTNVIKEDISEIIKKDINDINNKNSPIKNLKNEFPSLNTYSNVVAKTDSNIRKRVCSSYINRGKNNYNYNYNNYIKPEDELAELEKELKDEEALLKKDKYKRIDFSSQGDEWAAIVNYNKNLYQRQMLENKMKDLEIKKRTKECLDIQINEKLKRKMEEESQEKEFEEKINNYNKNWDEMYKIKTRKISEQNKRLKHDRDVILKAENTRKKIEKLKDEKFEKILVKKYKEQIELEKEKEINRRKKGKEELKKAKKDIEEKEKKLKENIEKEKEEDRKINQLRNLMDQRKENERNLYYTKIKSLSRKYLIPNAKKIIEKLEKDKKKEDEKIQYYYDQKNKYEFEKENKAKIKRFNDKIEIKKFLDMQIEEKKKEKNFLKLLDQEQARIWKIDLQKRYDEMKNEKEHIKNMNRKNFEYILKQMEQNKLNKSKKNVMTENEYAMNRDLLEKANEDYLKTHDN